MSVFSPENPFPMESSLTYAQEKAHAAQVDEWLGLRVAETEARIQDPRDGAERWLSVPPSTFLTPYTEIRRILEIAKAGNELVVDLGAAYGRMGFVLHRHFPAARFLGLELVPERVNEGNRVLAARGCRQAKLEVCDLSRAEIPDASLYFIYDFGGRAAVAKVLRVLQKIAVRKGIRVVGRGREVRDQIEREHPWLSGVVSPKHYGNFSIYASVEAEVSE